MVGPLPVIESATLLALGEKPRTLVVQLSRWVAAGKLVQLRRGVYLLAERFRRDGYSRLYLANLLQTPSYVSLECGLSFHGMIPEGVPLVQSVTTGRTRLIETPIGAFQYRHVKSQMFFGYQEVSAGNHSALVAVPEKALLDLFYLTTGEITSERIRGLRLEELDRPDLGRLRAMAESIGSPRLLRAADRVRQHIESEKRREVSL